MSKAMRCDMCCVCYDVYAYDDKMRLKKHIKITSEVDSTIELDLCPECSKKVIDLIRSNKKEVIDLIEEDIKKRDLEKDPLKIFPSRMALDDYIEDLKHVGYEVDFKVSGNYLRINVCRDNECYVRFCSFEMLTDEYKLMSEIEICANEVSSKLGDLNGED